MRSSKTTATVLERRDRIALTLEIEFELLWLLVRNKSSVITRERILSEIWHVPADVETRTVDAHIRNLRKKIGSKRIATVVGFGYRYDPPQGAD